MIVISRDAQRSADDVLCRIGTHGRTLHPDVRDVRAPLRVAAKRRMGRIDFPRSIAMLLPQPARQAEDPLDALEFVEPFLRDGIDERVAAQAGGATRTFE